jgi:uncharacterized membrane protein
MHLEFIILSVVFIVLGFFIYKFPPKKINSLFGYRTPASMKSQERWDFAQLYASKEMIKVGILILMVWGIVNIFSVLEKWVTPIFVSTLIIASLILIIRVERAIKNNFSAR